MTITEVAYQLSENRIPFEVHYSTSSFVVTIESSTSLTAEQLRTLVELGANTDGQGNFRIMGGLDD